VASVLGYVEIYEGVDNRDDRCKVIVVAEENKRRDGARVRFSAPSFFIKKKLW
jgi:hypothetical protein